MVKWKIPVLYVRDKPHHQLCHTDYQSIYLSHQSDWKKLKYIVLSCQEYSNGFIIGIDMELPNPTIADKV